ncbi:MAG TPA: hypothetical protein VH951_04545, partial [Dehalococcoidia bacterium]
MAAGAVAAVPACAVAAALRLPANEATNAAIALLVFARVIETGSDTIEVAVGVALAVGVDDGPGVGVF